MAKNIKPVTYGFGVDPVQSQNHFYIWIPSKKSATPPCRSEIVNGNCYISGEGSHNVQIYERFTWTSEGEQTLNLSDKLRIFISGYKWDEVKNEISSEFNNRLKKEGLKIGKFPVKGGAAIERLFGKEMMVLLWAIEDCDISVISTAIRNWKGLLPEERWWLYTMTNAATGELNDRKGWRTALRYALCENPVLERRQMTLFDELEG